MTDQHSAQAVLHATAIAIHDRGILLLGQSGSGKSDLALRLIDNGAKLIADDAVQVTACDSQPGRCQAAALPGASGRLMVRDIGIIRLDPALTATAPTLLSLAVSLDHVPPPLPGQFASLGQWLPLADRPLPLVHLRPFEASAPRKVLLALQRWGF